MLEGIFANCVFNLKTLPQERPTMAEVIPNLESVLALQEKTRMKAGDAKEDQSRIKSMKLTFSRMLRNFFCVEAQVISGSLDDNRNGSGVSVTSTVETCMNGKVTDRTCMNGGLLPTPDLMVYSYEDLRTATSNFKPTTLLGEGDFGRVYKGWVEKKTMLPSRPGTGIPVAVRKLRSIEGWEEWQAEINFLGRLSHPNLVKLFGYCWEAGELLLVYEFMLKRSFEDHLFRKRTPATQPFSWDLLLKIAIGAARGLAFLHSLDKPIIYGAFKSADILLDENYNARLSDFGLAKLGPSGNIVTCDYFAPEYLATGHLYVKSDVYGFGVVLLEMMTGLRAFDVRRPISQQNLVKWAKPLLPNKKKLKTIMDSRIEGQYSSKAALLAARLTLRCLQRDPKMRPDMKEVLEVLEQINALKVKPKET